MTERCRWTDAVVLASLVWASCTPSSKAPEAPSEPRRPVEVSAAVDRAVATVGDRLQYTLTVDRDREVEAEVPSLDPELAGLVLRDGPRTEVREEGERVVEEHRITLRVDRVGSYVLPPVTVRFGEELGDSAETSPLFIEVDSLLDRAAEAGAEVTDIRGLKPLERPASEVPWAWIVAAASLVGLLAALLLAWRSRRRRRPQVPPRPAHEIALERIAELEGSDLGDPAVAHQVCFALSETVRIYVEARFELNATDLTSEEIVVALPGVSGLETEPALELRRFLVATDRVKFADHRPSREEIATIFAQARQFVEATRHRAPEDAGESPGEARSPGDGSRGTGGQEVGGQGTGAREEAA